MFTLIPLLLFAIQVLAAAQSVLGHNSYHDEETAARVARTLVKRESLANLNTVTTDQVPVGFVEYYADCSNDGQPIMLMIQISSSNKNLVAGSNSSLTIRVGDHQPKDHVNTHYRGQVTNSVAGSPRINLKGHFVDYGASITDKECFARRHPEAVSWYPGNPIHDSRWVKFVVDSVYFVGGFGDRAYIGNIDKELYLAAKAYDNE